MLTACALVQKDKKKVRIKRQREAAAAESQGLALPPRKQQKVGAAPATRLACFAVSARRQPACVSLQTLESTRAWDETRVQPDDADNAADVAEDEFAGAARLVCLCAC